MNNNIGIIFLKNTPLILLCTFNFYYYMTDLARKGEVPWDQVGVGGGGIITTILC